MSRLRHPVRAIREPFGTAGLVVAVVALVAALGGSALAASGALTSKQKKEVEKIAKKYAGKPGAAGATGPAGAKGDNGTPGSAGADGTAGTPGSNGVSPVGTAFSGSKTTGGTTCHEGGVEYKGASTNLVCNGKEGEPGEEGSPWTKLGTLPPGATETGTWAFNVSTQKITVEVEGAKEEVTVGSTSFPVATISFPIPLTEGIVEEHVHFGNQTESEFHSTCAGTQFEPKAKPGELCVYEHEATLTGTTLSAIRRQGIEFGAPGASPVGAVLVFEPPTEEIAKGAGSFAVTGCSAALPEGDPNKCP